MNVQSQVFCRMERIEIKTTSQSIVCWQERNWNTQREHPMWVNKRSPKINQRGDSINSIYKNKFNNEFKSPEVKSAKIFKVIGFI